MGNFYPTKYYVKNQMTTLSERQLRRKVLKAFELGCEYVRKIKNSRGVDKWEIDINFFHLIGERTRKSKQLNIKENLFQTEVSLNFKDRSDRSYYKQIVDEFYSRTGFELVYKIEKEYDSEYSNHLHMGIITNDKKRVSECMEHIVKVVLQRPTRSRFNRYLSVNDMIDDSAFIDYISKGYDGLGGDFPEYILA